MKMRKFIIGAAAFSILAIPASSALAAGAYSAPGYDHAIDNTECADHGAFGFFGAQGDVHDLGTDNPGSNGRPGASKWQHPAASGATTGGNNSSLCGNGATPAPFTP